MSFLPLQTMDRSFSRMYQAVILNLERMWLMDLRQSRQDLDQLSLRQMEMTRSISMDQSRLFKLHRDLQRSLSEKMTQSMQGLAMMLSASYPEAICILPEDQESIRFGIVLLIIPLIILLSIVATLTIQFTITMDQWTSTVEMEMTPSITSLDIMSR